MKKLALIVAAMPLILIGWTFAPFTLEPAKLTLTTLPDARPPAGMSISALPTADLSARAGFAFRGGSFAEPRTFSQTALLVRHPRGDLLFDTGLGAHAREHFAQTAWLMRTFAKLDTHTPAATQLRTAKYDFSALRGIIPTHVHWDHVSGVPDFAGVPVWLNDAERTFVQDGKAQSALIRSFTDLTVHPYSFRSKPYLGYERSLDVWGDGSIVLVPAPGHTPGSLLAFITLPSRKRIVLLGDLVWQTEGITRPAERPWISRNIVDSDAEGVRKQIAHVAALHAQFPELIMLPAHDARAFGKLPVFPNRLD